MSERKTPLLVNTPDGLTNWREYELNKVGNKIVYEISTSGISYFCVKCGLGALMFSRHTQYLTEILGFENDN